MSKVEPRLRKILVVLRDGALDYFDLAYALGRPAKDVFGDCIRLRATGMVDWMYPEDEVSLSAAGRAALAEPSP